MAPLIERPLSSTIADAALSFRGYNITNLGRTPELLAIDAYRAVVVEELQRYGAIARDVVGAPVDLVRIVEERAEPDLAQYPAAIALIVAVEVAQLRLLRECHGIDYSRAKLAFGYSLGELMAVCAAGAFSAEQLIRVPLGMANDCAQLAHNVTLGILFSRAETVSEDRVRHLCTKIASEGHGSIGVSAVLSPNSYLVIGQGDSLARFKSDMNEWFPPGIHLRLNEHRWPPLHTPIVRQRHIPDRAAVILETIPTRPFPPRPAVLSLVTGKRSYDEYTARDILRQWVDHPQRLWDVVVQTLAAHVKTIVHVGPEPNVVPATFARLSENVVQQMGSRRRLRALSQMAQRPWLSAVLPSRAALLRAPFVRQIILEDWLIENAPR
jgi:[acyl-carrier-protein] S-malonyltransferase